MTAGLQVRATISGLGALTLAAIIAIAGCGSSSSNTAAPAGAATAPATHSAPATPSTAAAADNPVGTWEATWTTDPADVLGEYQITGPVNGVYTITTGTAFKLPGTSPGGSFYACALPKGTEQGTFTEASPGSYSGTEKFWYANTCTYAYTSTFTISFPTPGDNNTMVVTQQITLTRAGTPLPAAISSPTAVPATTPQGTAALGTITPDPAGTWDVATSSDPGTILGEYSIAGPYADGGYNITTETEVKVAGGDCYVPADSTEGSFSATGPDAFSGNEDLWYVSSQSPNGAPCAEANSSPFTLTNTNTNTMIMQAPHASPDPESVILTRVGSAPTSCVEPDVIEDPVADAISRVEAADFHVTIVTETFPGDPSFAAGQVWKMSPVSSLSSQDEPCGSIVTLYVQP
ncbi:MAG: hypothetical protein ACRDPY_33790 [Streptosporangiaceae bacterium]